MPSVRLPVRATASESYEVLQCCAEIQRRSGKLILDAGPCERVDPLGATLIALAVARRQDAGERSIELVAPSDAGVAKYLDEIAFPLHVAGTAEQRRAAPRHGTLEMRQLERMDPVYLKDVADLLAGRVPGVSEEVSHLIQLCLNELLQNVMDHAQSGLGCLVHTRWYRQAENVRLAVADGGIGIREAICRHSPEQRQRPERDVVQDAVMVEGFTSRRGRYGGFGLKQIRDLVTQREGSLTVISGGTKLRIDARGPRSYRTVAFQGTAIQIDFRPGMSIGGGDEEVF